MEQTKFNVQKRCEEIHAQYGTSEMANYRILLMCDKIENRAFEAGRQSVVEKIPNLEWERCVGGYVAETPIFNYYIEINETAKEKYTLIVPEINPMAFSKIYEAKRAAQENYKQRILKALGL